MYKSLQWCKKFRPHLSIMCKAICQFHQPFMSSLFWIKVFFKAYLYRQFVLEEIDKKVLVKGLWRHIWTNLLWRHFWTNHLWWFFRRFSRQPLCQASKADLSLRQQRSSTMEVSTFSAGQPGSVSPALSAQLVR